MSVIRAVPKEFLLDTRATFRVFFVVVVCPLHFSNLAYGQSQTRRLLAERGFSFSGVAV